MSQMEAYHARKKRNSVKINRVALLLANLGYKVYLPKDEKISFIQFAKNNRVHTFGFGEVPYRWYVDNVDMTRQLDIDLDTSAEKLYDSIINVITSGKPYDQVKFEKQYPHYRTLEIKR